MPLMAPRKPVRVPPATTCCHLSVFSHGVLTMCGAWLAVVSKELKRVIKSVNKSTRESQAILKTMAEANKKMKKERKRAQKKAKSEGKEFDDPTGHVLR